MKRILLVPIGALVLTLAFSVYVSVKTTAETELLQAQLEAADAYAVSGEIEQTTAALLESYDCWNGMQTYLHIVSRHDVIDDAEAMYRRALAFAAAQAMPELRAEIADLTDQLRLLVETEQCSIKNIL